MNNKYVLRLIVFAITIIAAVLLWPYFTQVDLPQANMSSLGAATVNTLVLAYVRGALPMLLMFSLGRGNYGFLLNFKFIAEEIVRTLVGSLDLVTAVPLTTAIAILFASEGIRSKNGDRFLGRKGAQVRIFIRHRLRSQRFPGTTRVSSR